MNSSFRRSIQNVPGLIEFISHSHATNLPQKKLSLLQGRGMIWFIKDSLIYSPVHGYGHGSSYMTRPCLVGTQCTPACLQARGGGSEPRSNRHDIMQSDCTSLVVGS